MVKKKRRKNKKSYDYCYCSIFAVMPFTDEAVANIADITSFSRITLITGKHAVDVITIYDTTNNLYIKAIALFKLLFQALDLYPRCW